MNIEKTLENLRKNNMAAYFVENKNEQILIDKYKTQLDLYKRALESATGRKVNKTYIYSTFLEKEISVN